MSRNLKTTLGSAIGHNIKQARGKGVADTDNRVLVRSPIPSDNNALANVAPVQGKVMPRHINMMFGADRQTYEGTAAYGPLGEKRPSRIGKGDRDIIKRLGGNDKPLK
jgi:hypothetical protein